MSNKDLPAHPFVAGDQTNIDDRSVFEGLTKREYAAIQIASGLVAKYSLSKPEDQVTIAQMSVELADTLFKELDQS